MFTQKRTFKSKITQKSCSKSLLQKKIIFPKDQKKDFLKLIRSKKYSKKLTQKSAQKILLKKVNSIKY